MERTMKKDQIAHEPRTAAVDPRGIAAARARAPRRRPWGVIAATVGVSGVLVASACSSTNEPATEGAAPGSSVPTGTLAEVPPAFPPPQLDRSDVDAAVGQLDGFVTDVMDESGIPGVAVAVVYQDEVVYAKGFGVRKVGSPEPVDTATVFELASVSKPLASSVLAGPVGEGTIAWDDPIAEGLSGFGMADPWVTEHVSYQDMLSHQSGLPGHAGDLLEDLGYGFDEIIERQPQVPLNPFRASYAYTNMGFSAAGEAAAEVLGTSWADLSEQVMYEPLGMDSTSSRFADYERSPQRAYGHVLVDPATKTWEAKYVRDADEQSPAGGASSSVDDMAKWLRMQLADGSFEGKQIVDPAALQVTRQPHFINGPAQAPAARSGAYGLGWNVSSDDQGRVKLGHSGAFALGAGTNVTMLPGEGLGIVVLTNGAANGAAETVVSQFFDYVDHGALTVDWWPFVAGRFEAITEEGRSETDYANPPSGAAAAGPDSAYVGSYTSPYYGRLEVAAEGDDLVLKLGRDLQLSYPLTHFDGDTFWFETSGENAVGPTGVTFAAAGGPATTATVEYLDTTGLGTFTRA
jgi:CubicO group peptidase (beta-lactamase class C family)